MTAFLHDLAAAALPVAIALLAGALATRAVPSSPLARDYLEPLATWSLVAIALHTFTLLAAGDVNGFSLALALALAAGGVAVRPWGAAQERPADPEPEPVPERDVAPLRGAGPGERLWAR
jgi:hypothetical protein